MVVAASGWLLAANVQGLERLRIGEIGHMNRHISGLLPSLPAENLIQLYLPSQRDIGWPREGFEQWSRNAIWKMV